MKNLAILLLSSFLTTTSFAQGPGRPPAALDPGIARQADSLRKAYLDNGYVVMNENSVNMESQYEFPVLVPLKAGTPYKFVFIGEMSSRLYEVRMFDWAEKQVFYKKHMWGDIDGNVIAFPYTPGQDEFHLLRVLQINKEKKKDLTGYVMMFRRTHSQEEIDAQARKMNGGATPAVAVLPEASQPKTDSTQSKDTTKKKNNYDRFLTGN